MVMTLWKVLLKIIYANGLHFIYFTIKILFPTQSQTKVQYIGSHGTAVFKKLEFLSFPTHHCFSP